MKTLGRYILAFMIGYMVNQMYQDKENLQLYVDEKLVTQGTRNYVQVSHSESESYTSIDCYRARAK